MTDSDPTLWIILLVLAVAAAAYCAWRWQDAAGRLTQQAQQIGEARARLEQVDTLTKERDAALEAARAFEAKFAAEAAGAQARGEAAADREKALLAMKAEIEKNFETLAQRALGLTQQNFLTLANETFEKHKAAAQGTVKEVVAPVQEQFAKLSETIAALDKARTEDKSALGEQMRSIAETLNETRTVTGKLAFALRGAPKTRGRWGEETLRNVLELSGLTSKVDFNTEVSQDAEGGKLRPDVIIRLPGGRCIVVDSKVALSGYLDAMEATDEAAREALLKKHAGELRAHMQKLGSKEYAAHVPDSADFVIMFVPGDNFLAAAFERDPDLYQDGFARKVIVIGPSNLFALAKTIAFGWRQEEIEKNAEEIAKLGRELFTRLAKVSALVSHLGGAMEKSVRAYNEMVSSLDTRVMVTARKFRDMGAAEGADLVEAQPIELAPRLPAPQAELDLLPGATAKKARRS